MQIILIDLLGATLGTTAVLVFFGTLWQIKKTNQLVLIGGIALTIAVQVVSASIFLNMVVLPAVTALMIFCLSVYFVSRIRVKILFSITAFATFLIVEMFTGMIFINVFGVTVEQIQENSLLYFLGILIMRLFVLLLVLLFRTISKGHSKDANNQFNWIITLMPAQSVIICSIVYFYSISVGEVLLSPLWITLILMSLSLIFVTMFIVKNLQKSIAYKQDYETAKIRLDTQLEHYEKLYQAQFEIRKIRHDISDNLLAISGMMESGHTKEALERINKITSDAGKTTSIVDTGNPAVDAVVNAKIEKAKKSGISIEDNIMLEKDIKIDSFDFAGLLANALDNAIEGILRSSDVEKVIYLNIESKSALISVIVENFTSGPVHADFRTSKQDEVNHGFGITQMRSIAEKHGGDIHPMYESETGKFTLNVLLKKSQNG